MCFRDACTMCCLLVHGSLFTYNGSHARDRCINITIVGIVLLLEREREGGREREEGRESEEGKEGGMEEGRGGRLEGGE